MPPTSCGYIHFEIESARGSSPHQNPAVLVRIRYIATGNSFTQSVLGAAQSPALQTCSSILLYHTGYAIHDAGHQGVHKVHCSGASSHVDLQTPFMLQVGRDELCSWRRCCADLCSQLPDPRLHVSPPMHVAN